MNADEITELIAYTHTLFTEAVQNLAGTRTTTITTDQGHTTTHTRPSRYQEIRDNITGHQGTHTGSIARSMPPLWVDAADWLHRVDAAVSDWGPIRHPTTPDALYALTSQSWRPQDTPLLKHHTTLIEKWVTQADQLLEPDTTHQWELCSPCPACSTRFIYRRDSGGDHVRQAALAITSAGCTCQACRTSWGPEYYHWLARVLNCPPVTGVLE